MKNLEKNRASERGSAGVKFLLVGIVIVLCANAGYNYIPVAYEGAALREDMDTAVVKGLAASGMMKPMDVVKASIQRAINNYSIPPEAVIEIKPQGQMIQAKISYSKKVSILPFGMYNYKYDFNYTAAPQGYLLKE